MLKQSCEVARSFGTRLLRVFSFYASPGAAVGAERAAVMERMRTMLAVAEAQDVVLLHENEKAIYGSTPERVKDLFTELKPERLKGIFDPANFVEEGVAPYDDAWAQGLAELTDWFHIKDKVPGEAACVPAGEGAGQFDEIFADLKARQWSGYMTLEPHLKAAGQFSGFTGPDLFARAVEALRKVCDRARLEYQ
jgi:sugar phosphate isomerase/epimerase